MIILIILIIVLLLSFTYIKNLFKSDVTILDDVKLKEEESNNNGFALMLEQEDGTYVESNSSTWPTNMKFNNELSGCIDVNGNKIENALSFNTSANAITVSTNKTAYCYVYFDIKPFCENNELLSNCIIRNSNEGTEEIWKSTLEGDGYRYVGTNPSNYICFGTTDKNTCVNDNMYRIIGVFEDSDGNKHAKLIKKEALNITYAWNSSDNVDWNESILYNGINGSYFLTNTSYPYMQDSTWTDKIATWDYTMTNTKTYENYSTNSVYGPYYLYNTGKSLYLHELNRSGKSSETCYYGSNIADCTAGEWKTLSTKISLMYVSDYALSLGSAALSYTSNSNYSTMKTGWMHLSNNDTGAPTSWEFTMSRYGSDHRLIYYAWFVDSDGYVSRGYPVNTTGAVRPVFYLESNVEYSSGTGASSDPFLLKVN